MAIFTDELILIHCANCGVAFGMTADYVSRRRADCVGFSCPAGHSNVYGHKSEADKLREQLTTEREAKVRAYAREHHALKQLSAVRGHYTRTKKRIANGVCPCCNRNFENLRRHMASKHPSFKNDDKRTI